MGRQGFDGGCQGLFGLWLVYVLAMGIVFGDWRVRSLDVFLNLLDGFVGYRCMYACTLAELFEVRQCLGHQTLFPIFQGRS